MQFLPPRHAHRESGFVLLAVIFLAVVLLISLAIAAPKIAQSIQREKETELIHRGEQYKRAIKLYYKKFGSYPTSVDQLVQTNQIRFLRKRYTDPITGKDDWKPVYFGQAHVRPLGFFGQPLSGVAGLAAAGAAMGGMSGSMYALAPAATDANGVPVAPGDASSTDANTSSAGSSSGSAFAGSSGQSSSFGSTGSSFGSTGSSFGSAGSSFGSATGSAMGATGGSTLGSTSSSPFGSTGSGTSATTFGGTGPIVGFTLPSNKASLIDYKKQTHYNQWEFNYDPMEDQMAAAAAIMGGGAGAAASATGTTTGTGVQSTGGGMGIQTTGSTTSSPTSPASPSAPDSSSPQ